MKKRTIAKLRKSTQSVMRNFKQSRKLQLLAFTIFFGLVGSVTLLLGHAATVAVATVEAENM